MSDGKNVLNIGDVHYDTRRELFFRNSGKELKLRPQSLQVFRLLATNPNEIVTKDELVTTVWADLHVSDDSLIQCIMDIRQALDDHDKTIIRTMPKHGYKLVVDSVSETQNPNSLKPVGDNQVIRYINSDDGTKIAWTENGEGMPILFAPDWGTRSIDLELRSQLFSPFLEKLGRTARIVRFDRRGNGLSDRDVDEYSLEADIADMEKVAEAAGLERYILIGKYGGSASAIAYAVRYPDRVLGIVSITALVTGHLASGDDERRRIFEVGMSLVEHGWDSSDPTFLRMVASRLVPNGPADIRAEIAEFYLSTTTREDAVRQYRFQHNLDVRNMAESLRTPLLILHARDCKLTPFSEARLLASLVPGARLIALDGEDFWPVFGTPQFDICLGEIGKFIEN